MKIKGQITVFFSLILLVIMAFVCTSLESARAAGLSLRLRLAADSSLQSVFAQYDRILWDEYGLLFWLDRDTSGSKLMQTASSYAKKNGDGKLVGVDWFSYEVENVTVQSTVTAVDQNGQVFRQAVNDYMRSCGAAETAIEAFGRLNVIDESGDLTESGTIWKDRDGKEEPDLVLIQEEYEDLQEELKEISEAEAENISEQQSDDSTGSFAGYEAANEENREEAESTVSSLMGTIDQLADYGFLAFVVDDVSAISDEPLDGEDLPSSLSSEERERNNGLMPETGVVEDLVFNEYVIRYLDAYTSKGSSGCQVEYVIAGKNSDRENLSSVAGRLVWVREGFNLAYILTDTEKKSQADGLAATLAGWTGLPPLVSGVSLLILTAWSMGESVADVKCLLRGEKIPLAKTRENWKLDLTGVADLGSEGSTAVDRKVSETEKDGTTGMDAGAEEKGLSYEDYLRILLFFLDREDVTYRTMDVIQRAVREVNPDFRMKSCIYSADIELIISAETVFPFLPGDVDYRMSADAGFAYGDIEDAEN